jgi:hypothetical protein
MISCQKATELASHSLDRPLNLWEKVALKTHLKICLQCKKYHQQLLTLHEATGRFAEFLDANGDQLPRLSPDARQKVLAALKNEMTEA